MAMAAIKGLHQAAREILSVTRSRISSFSSFANYEVKDTLKTTSENFKSPKVNCDAKNPKPFDAIPGPQSNRYLYVLRNFAPLIGSFGFHDRLLYDRLLLEEYGSVVRVPTLGSRSYQVHVYDPQDYAAIYQMEGQYPYRAPFDAFWEVIKDSQGELEPGITFLNNEEWFLLRRQLQAKMMPLQQLYQHLPSVEAITDEFIHMLQSNTDRENRFHFSNVRHSLQHWNVRALLKIMFNTNLGSMAESKETCETLIKSICDVIDGIDKTQTPLMTWQYLPNRHFKKLKKGYYDLTRLTLKYARDAIAETDNNKKNQQLPLLWEILDKNRNDSKALVAYLTDILFAGVHTTSSAAEMVLYFLSRNPEVQRKAYEEVSRVISDKSAKITPDILKQLRYTKACIRETLRFCPALSSQVRSFDKETVLSGYRIPAKTVIRLMFGVTGMSEKYFRHASQFMPERWLDEGIQMVELRGDPFASLPFGHGPRMCLGRRIAELELYLLVGKLLQNFVILPGHDIELRTNILTFAEPPVAITLQKRNK